MADNVDVTPGSGATMRTDDVGGVQIQAVKIVLGADGAEDCLVDSGQQTMANSVPVAIASNQTAVAVSAASLPLPSGAATEATLGGVALETGGNLATIAGDTTSLDTKITACDTTNVTVGSSALPTGAATESTLSTLDGKVTACNTGAVTISAALPTGTNTIGSVKLTDGTDTADVLNLTNSDPLAVAIVDTNGDQIASFGGGTQYTEDAAAAANPVGTAVNLVRQDTPAGLVDTDGDNVAQRGTNYGAAFCQIVTSSGAFVDTFGGSGGTAHQDDAAFSIGSASSITPMGALADDTTPDSVDEGDVGVPRMTLDRKLLTRVVGSTDSYRMEINADGSVPITAASLPLPTGAALEAGGNLATAVTHLSTLQFCVDGGGSKMDCNIYDAGGSITVDGSVNVSDGGSSLTVDITDGVETMLVNADGSINAVVSATDLDIRNLVQATDSVKVGDGANLIDVDVAITDGETNGGKRLLHTESWGMVFNGTSWDRMRGTAADGVLVNLGSNNDVTVTGTVTANLAAGTNTNEVVGDVAHDAAASGNPVLIAGVAQAGDDTAPPNRVTAEGDATRFATDFDGALYVRPHGPQVWSYHADGSTALTDATVHGAPAAGLSIYVGSIVFSSGAATAINMFFEEGSTTVLGPYYLEATAGRGMSITFNPPKKISAATALTVTTSAAIAHSVDVTGFIGQG